jgi:hypothetical protein
MKRNLLCADLSRNTDCSQTFYRVYQQGKLRDEDPDEIQEYMEWSGWYEICQDRRQR